MNNEIKYKGKIITVKFPSGMFEYYSDKEGKFLKFDTLKGAKESINKEPKDIKESIENKNIKLSEIRQLVKSVLNEGKEEDKVVFNITGSYSQGGYSGNYSNPVYDSEVIENYGKSWDQMSDKEKDQVVRDFKEGMNESVKSKTKKIKLSEIKQLVKSILKEDESKYNVIDLDANLSGDKEYFSFGIIKPLKKIMIFKNYGSDARIYSYFYKKYNLKPVDSNKFSVIFSGNEIDINKIPKKYKSFEIV